MGLDKPLHIPLHQTTSPARCNWTSATPFRWRAIRPVTELIARIWPVTFQLGPIYDSAFIWLWHYPWHCSPLIITTAWLTILLHLWRRAGIAVPNFIIATWFLLIFWLGKMAGGAESKWILGPVNGGWRSYLYLGIISCRWWTYALAPLALVSRYTRSSFADVLTADFIRTARSKGLSERFIYAAPCLPAMALIPMVTVLLPQIPNLFNRLALLLKWFMALPGLGQILLLRAFSTAIIR